MDLNVEFVVAAYKWDFSLVPNYINLWAKGLAVTLAYSVGTILGGMVIGIVCGMLLLSKSKWVTLPVHYYVEIFRCTPLLVQIVWFYYALPIVLDVTMPDWFAAGLGLTLYMGAFATEIFRGGIISIDKGQWQASRALGMTWLELMQHIILPQAIKRMTPPFVNQSIIQLKNTSLLYVVAIPDLMYTGSIIVSDTFRPLEVYTAVAVAYFVILYPLTLYAARLEARVDQ
jgi:polar amino acid transport system permease protein